MRISDWSSDVCSSDLAAGVDKSVFLGRIRTGTAIFEDTPEWQRQVDELKHRRPFQGFEYPYRHPDGRTLYFRIHGERTSVVSGKSVSVRVDLVGRRYITINPYNMYPTHKFTNS